MTTNKQKLVGSKFRSNSEVLVRFSPTLVSSQNKGFDLLTIKYMKTMKLLADILDELTPNEFFILVFVAREATNGITYFSMSEAQKVSKIDDVEEIKRCIDRLIELEFVEFRDVEGQYIKIKVINKKIKPSNLRHKPFIPPTFEEIKAYLEMVKVRNGYDIPPERVYEYYGDSNWIDSQGNPVKNWKAKILNNWLKPQYKVNTKNNNAKDNTYKQWGKA